MARRSGGLDSAQVQELRERLSNGGRPRVRLSGPQFAPDTVGTVVRIGDPAADGEDYVTVRARVGGVVDELAFSPAELTGIGKASAKVSGSKVAQVVKRRPGRPRGIVAALADKPSPAPEPSPLRPVESAPVAAAGSAATPVAAAGSVAAAPRTAIASVKISIASNGASWTVSADRGARALLRNSALAPGTVTAIAALLANSAVAEAVAAVNDTARGQAEARAEKLRAELAEVQAVLDSHRTP